MLSLLSALLLINVLLLTPRWLLGGHHLSLWIALEACLIVGLCALLPRSRWHTGAARTSAVVVVILSAVGFWDAVIQLSQARPLNLYLDLVLLRSVHHLLTGIIGITAATGIMVGGCLAVLCAVWGLSRLLCPRNPKRWMTRVLGWTTVTVLCVGLLGGNVPELTRRIAMPAAQTATDQVRHFIRMLNEQERFATELTATPPTYADVPNLLGSLHDRDVVLAFIESYGVSTLDDPRYAPVIRPRLHEFESRMANANLHVATGLFVAPIQGGQSWLAHGSLLSGTWLDNQLRYDLLLASERETLIDDFRRAGHRTVAVMPGITRVWPEGARLGYDQILTERNIAYAGPPLNWVTMPDQFVWSFFEHTVRATQTTDAASRTSPIFAELSLISSHAPWTPILPVLEDWDSIGNGSVFGPWEHAGERPEDLWRDRTRIQEAYARSVDYALNVMIGYAERYVDDRMLVIVLGDHQPAPLITDDHASRAVPVHVISGDPDLIAPFVAWGFARGGLPHPDQPPQRMDVFRDWFVHAFSQPVTQATPSLSRDPK